MPLSAETIGSLFVIAIFSILVLALIGGVIWRMAKKKTH